MLSIDIFIGLRLYWPPFQPDARTMSFRQKFRQAVADFRARSKTADIPVGTSRADRKALDDHKNRMECLRMGIDMARRELLKKIKRHEAHKNPTTAMSGKGYMFIRNLEALPTYAEFRQLPQIVEMIELARETDTRVSFIRRDAQGALHEITGTPENLDTRMRINDINIMLEPNKPFDCDQTLPDVKTLRRAIAAKRNRGGKFKL